MTADVLGAVVAVSAFGGTAIVLSLLWRRDSMRAAQLEVQWGAAVKERDDLRAALDAEREANEELIQAYREAGVDARRVLDALARRRLRPDTDGDGAGGDGVHRPADDATPTPTTVPGRTGSRGVLAGGGGAGGSGLHRSGGDRDR